MNTLKQTTTKITDSSVELLERIFLKEMQELSTEYWKWQERENVVNTALKIGMNKEFINQLKKYL